MVALLHLLAFGLVIGATALPGVIWLHRLAPLERLCLGVAGATVAVYLGAVVIYLLRLPPGTLALLPLLASLATWLGRARARAFLKDAAVRASLLGWLLLSVWCLGLHALVYSYSGGGWGGDWYEHYERARFFLLHWPLDHQFLGVSTLPARPPLANLAAAGFLGLTGGGFPAFQAHSTLLGTLVFLPLALLVGGRPHAVALLTVLLMLNPLMVQNATYPWTKLAAAHFVLLGVALLRDAPQRPELWRWALPAMAAGLVTHYSAGPWIVSFGIVAAWQGRAALQTVGGRRELLAGSLAGGAIAASWLGWSVVNYGLGQTVAATSTVDLAPEADWAGRIGIALANIRHTFVPNWDSPVLAALMQQPLWPSRVRDFWFCLYQQCLPAALGLGNLCVVGWLIAKGHSLPAARFWWLGVPPVIALNAAVNTSPVDLGLVHICLQPLVLLALTWIAGRAADFPRGLRALWTAGLTFDACLGIALHFGLQSLILPRLLEPGTPPPLLVWHFAGAVLNNYSAKIRLAEPFLADAIAPGAALAAALVALLLAFWVLGRSRPASAPTPSS